MKIIAVVGQKGGSGKSTTAICLASEWAMRVQRVLLVDADRQGTSRTWGEIAVNPRPTIVSMGANLFEPDQLPALAEAYDRAVIDCPPNNGEIQRAALMACDLAVLPCGPSAPDAWALAESIDLIRQARIIRPQLRAGVLVTRKQSRTVVGKGAREMLMQCGLPVFCAELGYRVAYQEALSAGKGVTTYGPNTPAAIEFRSLVDEIEHLSTEVKTHAAA